MSDEKRAELAYFEQDVKFDKRFYVNTCWDLTLITAALILYYAVHTVIFWGHVALGQTWPEETMWFFVACFIFVNLWIFVMVVIGHQQNKKYARHNYYLKKINDKQQENREQEQRDEQRRNQDAKIAAQGSSSGQH